MRGKVILVSLAGNEIRVCDSHVLNSVCPFIYLFLKREKKKLALHWCKIKGNAFNALINRDTYCTTIDLLYRKEFW